MAAIPLFVDLKDVTCLVVGAGRVAERKSIALRRAGARIRLVAPQATRRLRGLARRGAVRWRCGRFRASDLRGARLVLAATSDPAVNRAVARAAARRNLFVNVADDPEQGTVQMPAILRRGALVLAVSSSGRSPGAARAVRDDLAARVASRYAAYMSIVGDLRGRIVRGVANESERRRRLRAVMRAPILRLLASGRPAAAKAAARRAAGIPSRNRS